MLIHEKGGDMVNVPPKKKKKKKKKKKCRLARLGELGSPGRATSAPKYKNDEGGTFFIQKLSPLIQKRRLTGLTDFAALMSPFFRVFYSILIYYSSPTSNYLILGLSSFPLMYFGARSCMYLLKNVRDLSLDCCLFLMNWGVVGDGPRPMVHATLPPFLWFSCLNMRPPRVRWNSSMAFAHDFVRLSLWNKLCTYGCHCECVGSFVEARPKCQKHDLRLGI